MTNIPSIASGIVVIYLLDVYSIYFLIFRNSVISRVGYKSYRHNSNSIYIFVLSRFNACATTGDFGYDEEAIDSGFVQPLVSSYGYGMDPLGYVDPYQFGVHYPLA
jgi:hypothetical protein